jgi:hypothetical protein
LLRSPGPVNRRRGRRLERMFGDTETILVVPQTFLDGGRSEFDLMTAKSVLQPGKV